MNGWLSDDELAGEPRLEWDSVEPNDVAQGWIGNCWLISSIAALAEFPNAVQRLFVEADVAAGRYVIQLYDMGKAEWERVEIDDHVPCSHEAVWSAVAHTVSEDGRRTYRYEDVYSSRGLLKVPGIWAPLFGRPNRGKIWALLLEKAMAKFVGSYALLAGGSEPYALTALTGFPLVYCWLRPAVDAEETQATAGEWQCRGAQYLGRDMTGQTYTEVAGAPPAVSDAQLWAKLLEYNARNYLMTAAITKYRQPESQQGFFRPDGLVLGHAYSLISGRCAAKHDGDVVRLVMLRNPHGEGSVADNGEPLSQWNGAWSNGSECWDTHPEVAVQVGHRPTSDGVFWMCWEDFCSTFDRICTLPRSMEKPRAAASALQRRKCTAGVCLGLSAMADAGMWEDLQRLSFTFDPFASLPEFLDDGTLEARMFWEATKPGRLQAWLDVNSSSGNAAGCKLLAEKVRELGLLGALGAKGCVCQPGASPP